MGITRYPLEGQDNIKEAGGSFWDGRNDDTPLDEAPPEVVWSPSPYGSQLLAQTPSLWGA